MVCITVSRKEMWVGCSLSLVGEGGGLRAPVPPKHQTKLLLENRGGGSIGWPFYQSLEESAKPPPGGIPQSPGKIFFQRCTPRWKGFFFLLIWFPKMGILGRFSKAKKFHFALATGKKIHLVAQVGCIPRGPLEFPPTNLDYLPPGASPGP